MSDDPTPATGDERAQTPDELLPHADDEDGEEEGEGEENADDTGDDE